jgi:diadenosine tetraphosphate (Ap4A) HIT family hydrolase
VLKSGLAGVDKGYGGPDEKRLPGSCWEAQMAKDAVLYKRGKWIAAAADAKRECYSAGEVFIKVKRDKSSKIPQFLGEGDIPDRRHLLELIDIVSQIMMKALQCERVYLVSVGEGTKDGLHFRLLPRYREDAGFLNDLDPEIGRENDGLALMAKWRKQYLLKKRCPNRKPFAELRKKHEEAIKKVTEGLHKRPLTSND